MKKTIELIIRKKKSLERRRHQAIRLLEKADESYELKNIELWEAYEGCVKHQQDRMFELVKDIMLLQMQIIEEEQHGINNNLRSSFGSGC